MRRRDGAGLGTHRKRKLYEVMRKKNSIKFWLSIQYNIKYQAIPLLLNLRQNQKADMYTLASMHKYIQEHVLQHASAAALQMDNEV